MNNNTSMRPFISSLNATLLVDLKNDEANLKNQYDTNLHRLRTDYINKIAEFNIGDFIYNVTGIIKINKISYDITLNTISVVYIGKKYKKILSIVSSTTDNKDFSMIFNLKKLK